MLARTALRASGLPVLEGAALQDGAPAYWPLTSALRTQIPPGPDRAALLDAIAAALSDAAADGPVAVFLDDLQWADDATLDALVAMAAIIETEPVLVVGAYRSDEMPRGHPLRRLRSELRRQGRLHEVAVEPFAERETAALLAKPLGAEPSPVARRDRARAHRRRSILHRGARRGAGLGRPDPQRATPASSSPTRTACRCPTASVMRCWSAPRGWARTRGAR